ncbi:MAG: hypothetical protein AAB484_00355 [Patescibacteria group bacterium]
MKSQKTIIFVLFGATGDLAVKKIFPALETLYTQGVFSSKSTVIAVSRRDWNDSQFLAHAGSFKSDFAKLISYSRIDIEHGTGYENLYEKIEKLKKKNPNAEVLVYLSLAPRYQSRVIESLAKEKIMIRGGAKLLIEKPFGTDEKSAKALDILLLSSLDESQIYRIDHYLGKDTVMTLMNLHESTENFSLLLSRENISQIHIRLFETKGIEGRGASYDHVGAFRDVGQNHILEMLAVLAADVPKKSWTEARTDVLKHLTPPAKTCELSHRGQYDGYKKEAGVKVDSETETAFKITTSLSYGKLAGVPLILEAGKKMPVSEVFMEIIFKAVYGLPKKMHFNVQPDQEIITLYRDGKRDVFKVPKVNDAYANVIKVALNGSSREFVGSSEIEALWRYADHIVACWNKVPLQIYGEDKPFLIQ